jgi:DNA-binding ferritin-like protein
VANDDPSGDDAIAALNQVLSEVIDFVQEVKQAHRKIPENHQLHAQLDRLFEDLRSWARLLVEEDEQLGVSPLASMPSVAGRTPPNLWPRTATDEEVRLAVVDHLDRLAGHVSAALAKQYDAGSQTVLAEIQQQAMGHVQALSDP